MNDDIPEEVQNSVVLELQLFREVNGIESTMFLTRPTLGRITFRALDAYLEHMFPGWEVYKLRTTID